VLRADVEHHVGCGEPIAGLDEVAAGPDGYRALRSHLTESARLGHVSEPFDPPGEPWVRVSPRLSTLRRLLLVVIGAPVAIAVGVLFGLAVPWLGIVVGVAGLVGVVWGWLVVGRAVRSWGYAERADDLLVTRGILNRQLVVVPYGRMQYVDVTAGPLDRKFGLSTVQLHTAAAATDARIPGLVPTEAARLRDRLAARGEASSAGL
jgi:membrane protein YdbS with pleckstrin-like domain